jgi:hypothetical protein
MQTYDAKYFNMVKTLLKVINASCCRLMSLYHMKPCMSRSRTTWSRWVHLVECSRSSFVLTVLCRFLSLSLPAMPLTAVSGKSRLLVLDSVLEPIAGVVLPKKCFISRTR